VPPESRTLRYPVDVSPGAPERLSLHAQRHRRFDGCPSQPTAWLSPGRLAERVLTSNCGRSTTEIGAPPALKGGVSAPGRFRGGSMKARAHGQLVGRTARDEPSRSASACTIVPGAVRFGPGGGDCPRAHLSPSPDAAGIRSRREPPPTAARGSLASSERPTRPRLTAWRWWRSRRRRAIGDLPTPGTRLPRPLGRGAPSDRSRFRGRRGAL
jgi:hypothetical protein